jgi:L-amino acid N-acyltransferase YncA
MNIREANKKDAHGIAKVHVNAWKVGYAEIMAKEYLDSLSIEQKTEIWLQSLSEVSLGVNLVIEENNKILGFSVFGPARDTDILKNNGELVALNILPSHWGKGLGSKLIKYVLTASKANKWEAVYLWVLKKNKKARAIYEAHGFVIEGLEKHDKKLTGHELHEIRYVKYLS